MLFAVSLQGKTRLINGIKKQWSSLIILLIFPPLDSLVTADEKARTVREVIEQRERHAFWWTPEFVSVELFKAQKYPKQGKS